MVHLIGKHISFASMVNLIYYFYNKKIFSVRHK